MTVMDDSRISGLSVFASGVHPVELSLGKRVNGHHRVPVKASVEDPTGEVRFYVEAEAINILDADSAGR